jgi:Bacterial SH3 domain
MNSVHAPKEKQERELMTKRGQASGGTAFSSFAAERLIEWFSGLFVNHTVWVAAAVPVLLLLLIVGPLVFFRSALTPFGRTEQQAANGGSTMSVASEEHARQQAASEQERVEQKREPGESTIEQQIQKHWELAEQKPIKVERIMPGTEPGTQERWGIPRVAAVIPPMRDLFVYVQRAGVNIRSTPVNGRIIGAAPKGTRFEVQNREGEWVQVESVELKRDRETGKEVRSRGRWKGWINAQFLAATAPE